MPQLRWVGLTLVALLLAPTGARAGEPPAGAPAPARESVLERGLGALRVRMEAKLKEAELLQQQGRLDDALAAVREVERLYRETMADLQRLVAPAVAPPFVVVRPQVPTVPPVPLPIAPPLPEELRPRLPFAPAPPPAGRVLDAVTEGLRWLAAHQAENGGWEAAGFGSWCEGKPNTGEKPDGAGKASYDTGVTGLALSAFLALGYTNRSDHEFARTVRRGLAYLKNVQDPEGCFGPRSSQHFIYNHACAALAMVEAYGLTQSPIFKGSAQKALDFIALSRNPYFTWRYGVKPGDNDTSITGWMTLVIEAARRINADARAAGGAPLLTIDEEAFEGVLAWIDKMTDPDYGRVGYTARGTGPARPQELVDRFPAEKSEAMTAVGILLRIFGGQDPARSETIRRGLDLIARLPPTWNPRDGSIDMTYWYFATLACYQAGGSAWTRWSAALEPVLLASQRRDGTTCAFKGSYDPLDPWGSDGGRVYSTALMCLSGAVAARGAGTPGGR